MLPVASSDVMEEILIRSNAIDLVPWKRVCKSWYSLITTTHFVKAHLNMTLDNNNNNNGSNNWLVYARIVMPSYWKIPNEKRLYQYNRWKVVGSCNGLVCISNCLGDPVIVVNNPCTRELRILPMAPLVSEEFGTGSGGGLSISFAYDSSTDDYKVVMGIKKSEDVALVQVLSLKSNTWKTIGQFNYSFIFDAPGILFNGKLHWVVYDYNDTSKRKEVILSFDLSREEFKVIPQPNDSKYRSLSRLSFFSLGIVDDQFCLYFRKRLSLLPSHIWVMRSYNVDQSWELLPDTYEMMHEVVHYMKMLDMNEHTTFFFDDNKFLPRPYNYIKACRFVPSLVSPYAGRPSHAKNNKTNFIAWSFKAVVGEEGQPVMVRRIVQASEEGTRKIEEVYRQEVGETENVFVHEDEWGEIEETRTKLEGVTLCG